MYTVPLHSALSSVQCFLLYALALDLAPSFSLVYQMLILQLDSDYVVIPTPNHKDTHVHVQFSTMTCAGNAMGRDTLL